jgi:hypothetical protein
MGVEMLGQATLHHSVRRHVAFALTHPTIMVQIPLATVVRIKTTLVMINLETLVLVLKVVTVLLKTTTTRTTHLQVMLVLS